MDLDEAVKELHELIRRDYLFPRFVEMSVAKARLTSDGPPEMPKHISVKECVLPLLKDYEITKKREAYCIELVKYFTGGGCLFPYLDNIKKQEFMNQIADALPEVNLRIWYQKDCTYPSFKTGSQPAKEKE